MGKAFSALTRKATKPIRDFNIEDRAHKSIMRETRPTAPRHATTIRIIEESIRNQPEALKQSLKEKDSQLLQRLKDVYVTSQDVIPKTNISPKNPDRPLPLARTYIAEPEYGFHEPVKIPYGKLTLRDALDAISKHQENPDVWTAQKISHEFKIDTGLTEKMLHYFRTFVLILPDPSKKDKVTREMLRASPLKAPLFLKQLPSGNKEDSKDREEKSNKDSKKS